MDYPWPARCLVAQNYLHVLFPTVERLQWDFAQYAMQYSSAETARTVRETQTTGKESLYLTCT
jgi:hypothetical protein